MPRPGAPSAFVAVACAQEAFRFELGWTYGDSAFDRPCAPAEPCSTPWGSREHDKSCTPSSWPRPGPTLQTDCTVTVVLERGKSGFGRLGQAPFALHEPGGSDEARVLGLKHSICHQLIVRLLTN